MEHQLDPGSADPSGRATRHLLFFAVGLLLFVAISGVVILVLFRGTGESEMDRIFREVPQTLPRKLAPD